MHQPMIPMFFGNRPRGTYWAIAFDIACIWLAWVGGFLLRFNFEWPAHYATHLLVGGAALTFLQTAANVWSGLYRGIWQFASLADMKRLLRSVFVVAVLLGFWVALERSYPAVPRSLLVLYPVLVFLSMSGGRLLFRIWFEHRQFGQSKRLGKPVVMIGAGSGAALLSKELDRSADWQIVAYVDDDRSKWGLEMHGHPIVGGLNTIPQVLATYEARHVILAMPSAEVGVVKRATDIAVSAGAHVFTVPGLEDLLRGASTIKEMRPISIEDILGRDAVSVETELVRDMVANKTILVTGAGGSIGSELCRQLSRFSPSRLVLLEQSEFALYSIDQWFSRNAPSVKVVTLVGDVKDQIQLERLFNAWRPEIVFHAAAYKHVPLMEVNNAWQAVRNNVLGTLRLAEVSVAFGAAKFVLVSTDKAVNPTNVMGATKRLAEMVCTALACSSRRTQFEIVRFGNVLGSTGSVIPKFKEQIAIGGPVTVTHPEINRYFMSIPEAAQLVLQAATMGKGGEIFVLDMGQPIRIADLARNMIKLSGYSEDEVRIEFTGLRPGEKLYEELLADSEMTTETRHPKLRIAQARTVSSELVEEVSSWLERPSACTDEEVRAQLKTWIPEYQPANI